MNKPINYIGPGLVAITAALASAKADAQQYTEERTRLDQGCYFGRLNTHTDRVHRTWWTPVQTYTQNPLIERTPCGDVNRGCVTRPAGVVYQRQESFTIEKHTVFDANAPCLLEQIFCCPDRHEKREMIWISPPQPVIVQPQPTPVYGVPTRADPNTIPSPPDHIR